MKNDARNYRYYIHKACKKAHRSSLKRFRFQCGKQLYVSLSLSPIGINLIPYQ